MALQMGRAEGRSLRLHAPAVPRGSQRAPARRRTERRCWRTPWLNSRRTRHSRPGGRRSAERAHGALRLRGAPGARQARAGRRLRRGLRIGRTGAHGGIAWWAWIAPPKRSTSPATTTVCPTCASSRLLHRAAASPMAAFDLVVAFEVIEHLEDWRELPAGGAPRAGAQRPVHRLHAQQALLHRIARRRRRQSVPRARIRFRGIPRRAAGRLPARVAVPGKPRGGRHLPAARGGRHGGSAGGCRRAGARRIALLRGRLRAPPADRQSDLRLRAARRQRAARARAPHRACSKANSPTRTSGWRRRSRISPSSTRAARGKLRASELERSNRGPSDSNRELEERRARVAELQEELAREQENARQTVADYEAKVASWRRMSAPRSSGRRTSRPR